MPGIGDLNQDDFSQDNFDFPIPTAIENVFQLENSPDSSNYLIGGANLNIYEAEQPDFNSNLAETIDENELDKIAGDLLDDIKNDIQSRSEWETSFNRGIDYLGFKVEEYRDWPFARSCGAYDTTLSSALLRFYSTARAELFPASGPARYKIAGEKTEELEQKGEKIMRWMNHYLTDIDREYYPDSERLLMYLGIVGCAFRKVYQDPLTGYPKARFIDPQDFIVNNKCTTILSSNRLTHRQRLTKKEIMFRQMSGFYRDIELPDINDNLDEDNKTGKNVKKKEGIEEGISENKSLFLVYEVHADLSLDGSRHESEIMESSKTGVPLPYIVAICATNRKILSIRRNWIEGDQYYNRIQYFIQYNYLPGLGIYGLGLSQLLGSNAIVLTAVIRQLIDAGTLKNFPGGLKKKGMKVDTNDKAIGPSEFWDVDTGGLPIQDVIMLMPYGEPSTVLKDLRTELKAETQQLASTAETQLADAKPEAPVGTTLALIEVANKVQSSILRSLNMSLGHELELILSLFAEGTDGGFQFADTGYSENISQEDFIHQIKIIPVSDPTLTTSTQRILRAEGILRLAQSAPHLHNMRNAYHRMYSAMNVEDIDRLLPPEQEVYPLDPITENMNMLENKPVKAAIWQDHQAHAMSHQTFLEQNPDVGPVMMAHMAEHRAYEYLIEIEQQMGIQMPPLEELMEPEIQNAIAMKSAEASSVIREKMMAENAKQQPDPNAIMLADIKQRQEAEMMKLEITKMKVELESFKAQLKFESEKTKIESNEKIAEEKNEVDLVLAGIKAREQSMKDSQRRENIS